MKLLNNRLNTNYQIAFSALVVSVSYYLGAKIGLHLSFKPDYMAALWPPNAILLAALVLSKPKYWWCFLLASVPAEMAADLPSGIPLKMAIGFLAGDWAEALTGALLLRQFHHVNAQKLSNLKRVTVYLACCVVCAPFLSAFVGALTPILGGTPTGYWAAWRAWFLGDALTHLTVTPTLILGFTLFKQISTLKKARYIIEVALISVLLIIVSYITFGLAGNLASGLPVLLYLPLPILLWVAVRFGTRGIFPAILLLTIIAIWTASNGQGPFSHQTVTKNVMSLQFFLMVALTPLVLLASLIEERKRSGQQLTIFRSLLDKSNDAIFVVDPETSRFADANNTACKRYGYTRLEMLEKSVKDINPDFKNKSSWEDYVKQIKQSQTILVERKHTRKNGTTFPVEASISYISLMGKKFILAVVRDITERKRIEDQLKELVETVNDWIWSVDSHGKYTYSSPQVKKLLGYTPEEVLGKTPFDFMPVEEAKTIGKFFNDKVSRKESFERLENVNVHKDGRHVIIETSATPVLDHDGTLLGYRGIDRDITDRKKLEEELLKVQKLESTGVLAGGIAHDFNNLLTAIMGNVSMAKMYITPEEKAYSRLEETEKATMRARDLTQQLLTFSKGGAPVTRIVSILGAIEDSANFILSGSNVRSEFDFADNLWTVDVDEGQISQVIQNLVKNADQAMPKGGIIKISAQNIQIKNNESLPLPDGRYVHLSVADQGSGIPEEDLVSIFDPYFTTKQQGSGLGLASAYSIITNHGGLITAESQIGKGTFFNIYLPASEQKSTAQDIQPERLGFGSGRILIMDDEANVREVVSSMLSHLGYDVELAVNGEEAIEIYQNAQKNNTVFDAVILDLTVPGGFGGRETVKKLIEIDPAVKAIISSGYSNNPVMADYRKYGFCGLIKKPFRIQDLSDTLSRCNLINDAD